MLKLIIDLNTDTVIDVEEVHFNDVTFSESIDINSSRGYSYKYFKNSMILIINTNKIDYDMLSKLKGDDLVLEIKKEIRNFNIESVYN